MPKESLGPRGDQRPGPVAPSDPDGRFVEIADGKVVVSDEGPTDRLLELRLRRPLVAALGRQSYRRMGLPPPATWQELHRHLSLLASVRFSDLADGARKTRAPALVAHCRDDRLVEIDIARELAATLPRGRLVELESGGHHLQKSRARELATAIENFLTEAEPGS